MNKVAILLSTYNGENFLKDLLKSIEKQRKVDCKIFILDDKSDDKTLQIINDCKLSIKVIKKSGFRNPSKNFCFLLKSVPLEFDYYCFCDQDDVWLKNKTINSIWKLKKYKADIIGTRTFYTDKDLNIYSKSIFFKKKICFENSLVQSIAGGNTLTWTKKFHETIQKIELSNPASHDWMLYQIASLLSFKYIYSERPTVLYRQHSFNQVGANISFKSTIKRIFWGIKGRYKEWHDLNKDHLFSAAKTLKSNDRKVKILNDFYNARNFKNPFKKINIILFKNKILRQTLKGNLMLILAILINKI